MKPHPVMTSIKKADMVAMYDKIMADKSIIAGLDKKGLYRAMLSAAFHDLPANEKQHIKEAFILKLDDGNIRVECKGYNAASALHFCNIFAKLHGTGAAI